MHVRVGGTVIECKSPTQKIWPFLGIILFLFCFIYLFAATNEDGQPSSASDSEAGHIRGRQAAVHPQEPQENQYEDVEVPAPRKHHKSEIHNRRIQGKVATDSSKTAMSAAGVDRRTLTHLANQIFMNQKKPNDSFYNINVSLSDRISLDRPIQDTRPDICRTFTYQEDLGSATIVIPFYNEALSMLLRTVHSVLNRSPDKLLDEIILVDDKSTFEYLLDPLKNYVDKLPKVTLIRNENRDGLIKSRMYGFRLAKSPVVIFLDAHTEANEGWLEPLLFELKKHPHYVIQPFVDGIDTGTIKYSSPPTMYKGSFSWDLRYTWLRVPDHETNRVRETGHPFWSPTLVGCAIAVEKSYFESIGGFDEDMKIWGGENIELGFRNWMCGGAIVTVPCSRVGHVFKNFPYKFDGDRDSIVQKNLMRVAETWMDGLKKYFYASTRIYEFKRVDFNEEDIKTLQTRKDLRTRLKCENFEWYMRNVIPEFEIPSMDSVYYGELMNLKTRACLEVLPDYTLGMNYYCYEHKVIPKNIFRIDKHGLMRYDDKCVTFEPPNPMLKLAECPVEDFEGFGQFELKNKGHVWGVIRAKKRNSEGNVAKWCVSQVTNVLEPHKDHQMPQLGMCEDDNPFQVWAWTYKFDFDL